MTIVVVLCSHCRCRLFAFNRFAAPSISGLFTLGWMCPHKREQASDADGTVSYDSLTHSKLYCTDREKK